ncbi:MAG: DUF1553 domain-containing protein, partial [Planctomycetes bacterium]|nr:DUF1553 domain-containing protein [Planctomycetota bacterium]
TYQQQITALQKQISDSVAAVKYVDPGKPGEIKPPQPTEVVWIDDALPAGASPQGNEGGDSWNWVAQSEQHLVFSGEKSHRRMSKGLSQHFFTGAKPGLKIVAGDRLFAYVYIDPDDPPREIMLQFNDGSWDHRAYWGKNLILWGKNKTPSRHRTGLPVPRAGEWVRLEVDAQDVGLKPGSVLNGWAFTQFDGTVYWDKAGVVTLGAVPSHFDSQLAWEEAQQAIKKTSLPKNIQDVLKVEREKRSEAQANLIRDYFIKNAYTKTRDILAPLNKQLAETRKQTEALDKAIPSTLVMREKTKNLKETYLLVRGEYDKPDKNQKLDPGVPASLHAFPSDTPVNRLGLAKWLVDTENPLTARVTVNRFWQQFFGIGIIKTTEEFGSQGEWPSHPQLIDWLATEFIQNGWDVKRMQKLIVMSGTYRQSPKVTPELFKQDPENRLLARGPRFRLDAEMIRDNALFLSGLLVEKIGGPSIKPYQPLDLWKEVAIDPDGSEYSAQVYVQDMGEELYRRSMYIFRKRSVPPPSLAIFDAPNREVCTVRRERTNTPLQALVLMNDPTYVEAARHLAQRLLNEAGPDADARAIRGFRLATARVPSAQERTVLVELFNEQLRQYQSNPEQAEKLLAVGDSPVDESLDRAELAAWTIVASVLLNLDETITRG